MGEDRFSVGDRAALSHTFTQADVEAFAVMSGDRNPIHFDVGAAREAGFDGPIIHGLLGASLISRLLGMDLPGVGTVYLSQEFRFRRPIYPGQIVAAEVEITSRREDKPIYTLATRLVVDGQPAVEGEAVVLVRD